MRFMFIFCICPLVLTILYYWEGYWVSHSPDITSHGQTRIWLPIRRLFFPFYENERKYTPFHKYINNPQQLLLE